MNNITKLLVIFYYLKISSQSRTGDFANICMDYNLFYQEYAIMLNKKTIKEFFAELPQKKIEKALNDKLESYQMAEIDLPNNNSFIIKKILVEDIDPYALYIYDIFKESPYIPNLLVCTEYLGYLYIFNEKLYKNFSDDDGREEFLQKNLTERIDTYLEMSRGIKALHKKKMVHNDITPENIMSIDENFNKIKLIDYQFTNEVGDNCKGGTPLTNSPEKNWGKTKSELSIDVYAFGMTIVWIEMGMANLYEIGYLNFFNNYELANHTIIMKGIKDFFEQTKLYKIEVPGNIVKFWHYFKSFFYANHMERIYTFDELLLKMMDFEPSKRPTMKEIGKKLKQFKHQIVNINLVHPVKISKTKINVEIKNYLAGKFGLKDLNEVKADAGEILKDQDLDFIEKKDNPHKKIIV